MDRLTYWNDKGRGSALPVAINEDGDTVDLETLCEKLAHLEDLHEQGRLVVLPCKVGDTVFSLWSRVDSKKQYIRSATITVSNLIYYMSRIKDGRSFATRAEAQAALGRMEGQE